MKQNIFIIRAGNALSFISEHGERRFCVIEPGAEGVQADMGIDASRLPAGGRVPEAPAEKPALKARYVKISEYVTEAGTGWGPRKTGVCATHLPTGLEAKCAEHKSQWRNMDAALDALAVMVQEHVTKELRESLGDLVKALADMAVADSTAPSSTKDEEAELTARMEEFITALNQPAERPEVPGFEAQAEGWGTGWQAGDTHTLDVPVELAGATLAPDQFGYVDAEAGTLVCEDVKDLDSRVAQELIKRGWTPPGQGPAIKYPEVMRSTGVGTSGSEATTYRNGWNDCRNATMTLNRVDRRGNRS